MKFETWQQQANSLLDYKIVYINSKVSAIPLTIKKNQIEKWTIDLLKLMTIARNLSLKNTGLLHPREDLLEIANLYLNKPRQPTILRPDCILKNGKLLILELNIDSALGGLFEIEQIKALMKKNPLYCHKNRCFPSPKNAVSSFFSDLNKIYNINNIAVLGSEHTEPWNIRKIQEFCKWIKFRNNFEVYYLFSNHVMLNNSTDMRVKDTEKKLQVLYRYRSLLHPQQEVKEFINLLKRAYYSSSIVLSDPADLFIEHKGVIALLSEAIETAELTLEERNLIQNYIPWTRFLSKPEIIFKNKMFPTKEFCLNNKDFLVLKRMFSHQGKAVFVGAAMKNENWVKAISHAFKEPNSWVIQEKLDSDYFAFGSFDKNINDVITLNRQFIFSPVFFGNYFGGSLVRLLPCNNKVPPKMNANFETGLAALELV